MRLFFFLGVLLLAGLVGEGAKGLILEEKVDTEAFFKGVEGNYRIILAGGETPKPENNVAEILADVGEGAMAMPYCPKDGDVCDPGYLFLAYEQTTVFLLNGGVARGADTYEIRYEPKGRETRVYYWKDHGGYFIFQNPQYQLQGDKFLMEHTLVREDEF